MGNLFEWDPAKAASNVRKHGISFEVATRVFSDPYAITLQDVTERDESRWLTVGMVSGLAIVVVVHAGREIVEDGRSVEVIRIISARSADRKERRRYEQKNDC